MNVQGQILSLFKIVVFYSSWGLALWMCFYITLEFYLLLSEFPGAP